MCPVPDELAAIRERFTVNYHDQPAMVYQDLRYLLDEADHARQTHVTVWGPVSYPIEGWLPCEKCGQGTYNTSTGVG